MALSLVMFDMLRLRRDVVDSTVSAFAAIRIENNRAKRRKKGEAAGNFLGYRFML